MEDQETIEEPRTGAEQTDEVTPEGVTAEPAGEDTPQQEPAAVGRVASVRRVRSSEPMSKGTMGTLWTAIALIIVGLVVGGVILAVRGGQSSKTPSPLANAATPAPVGTPVIKGGSIAAVVNGHDIPTSTYRMYLNLAWKQSAGQPGVDTKSMARASLNQVIINELVRQFAQSHHLSVPSSELNAQINHYKAQNGGAKGFPAWLSSLGLTYTQFKSILQSSLLEGKVVDYVAPVHPARYSHVRHILITTSAPPGGKATSDAKARAKAESILKQLQHGASFAALAKKYSQDPGSAPKGGDLGDIYPGDTVAVFDHAAFTLPLNKPAIVHSQFGYHIVEVLARGKKVPPPGSRQRQEQQQTKFQAWESRELKRSKIKRIATVAS